jgi:glutamine---fructose-6-phosphate transaminase (isomerizing)
VEDWYDESFPEYRPAPPWVMEDMLAAEPSLPSAIAERAAAAAEVARLARAAHRNGERIAVAGCGTSEHAAQAIAALISDALAAPAAEARQALDAVAAPYRGGLCIAVSHEGETAATIAALAAARRQGASTALVTAGSSSRAARHADVVVDTPVMDRSWCHTIGYVAPILAGGLIAAELAGDPFDADLVERFLGEAVKERVGVGPIVAAERLLTAGAGADAISAREFALKAAEGARFPSTALELENVLHGHLVGHDNRSALVIFATEPAEAVASQRAGQVLTAAARIGLAIGAIASADLSADLGSAVLASVQAPPGVPRLLGRLLGGAIALQLVTIELARARGVNPDLLRREEEPYREAARLGEKKTAEVFLDLAAES